MGFSRLLDGHSNPLREEVSMKAVPSKPTNKHHYNQSRNPLCKKQKNVIPFSKQLMMFHEYQRKVVSLVGRQRTSSLMSESIFAISSGSNDFILNYLLSPRLQLEFTSTEWSTFVLSNQTQFVKQLYEAGARKFLIYGFPPLGCLPAIITLFGKGQVGCVEDKNQIAIAHNIRVHALFSQWQQDLPKIRILYGDAYTFIYDAFNNPSKYGYTETRRACCAEGLLSASVFCNAKRRGTCADPSTYMFFDSVHPTESVYKVLAEEAWINMVPFFGLQK